MSLSIEYSQLKDQYKIYLTHFCRSSITVNYLLLGSFRFMRYLSDLGMSGFRNLNQEHCRAWINFLKDKKKLKEESLFYNARCTKHFIAFLISRNIVVGSSFPATLVLYQRPKRTQMINPPEDAALEMLTNILKQNLNTYENWKSYLILRLLLLTKFTITDILRMRDSDIDLNKMTIILGASSKQSECSMELVTDIKKFIFVRDRNTPAYSNYLIRSVNGYFMDYTMVKTQIFKQWCLFSSTKINATIVKRFRHRKLQQSVGVHEFRRLTGYSVCYCYAQFY